MTSTASLLLPTTSTKPPITRDRVEDRHDTKETKSRHKFEETDDSTTEQTSETKDINFNDWINTLIPLNETVIKNPADLLGSAQSIKTPITPALLSNAAPINTTSLQGTPITPPTKESFTTNLAGTIGQNEIADPATILTPVNDGTESLSIDQLKQIIDTLNVNNTNKNPEGVTLNPSLNQELLAASTAPSISLKANEASITLLTSATATKNTKPIDVRLNKANEINLYALSDASIAESAEPVDNTVTKTISRTMESVTNATPQTQSNSTPINADSGFSALLPASLSTQSGNQTLQNFSTLTVTTGSLLTNPINNNQAATQAHAATQAVAATIHKNIKDGITGSQSITMRLDPAELGRMDIRMEYKKGDPLKVHLVVEKEDTMNMFMRDKHVLETALNNAGIKTENLSLSFEQNQNAFEQNLNGQQNHQNTNTQTATSLTAKNTELTDTIETKLDIFIDERTGRLHYNMMV